MSLINFFDVLRILADGKKHSGEEISKSLNCSRTLIWQAIHDIQNKFSLPINCIRGHGYYLNKKIELLDEKKIEFLLDAESRATYLINIVEQIDSTNTYLMQSAAKGAPHGIVLASEWQNAGRGRQGKQWQIQFAESLTFSILWRFDCGLSALSGLSLAIGVAIVKVLRAHEIPALLKWPNDILLENKKLSGILIELTGDALGPIPVIIGVGLNITAPEILDQPACGLPQNKYTPSRNQLLAELLNSINTTLKIFCIYGFTALREEWKIYCMHINKPIRMVLSNSESISGIAIDVDNKGALQVKTNEGIRSFQIGEVSLRNN